MGATLTAEFIALVGRIDRFDSADALAAAAGLAPVLRQSGKTSFLRRAAGGDKALKRVFYQAAFTSLGRPDSRAFYDRKRAEGKRHHQAVIALARRRVNVLWAILHKKAALPRKLQNGRLTEALGCQVTRRRCCNRCRCDSRSRRTRPGRSDRPSRPGARAAS
ncbi:MAG: transposase [Rhodobacteraceae bacterium]|nr:transposase [Paracoccaceae bacterium]